MKTGQRFNNTEDVVFALKQWYKDIETASVSIFRESADWLCVIAGGQQSPTYIFEKQENNWVLLSGKDPKKFDCAKSFGDGASMYLY